jgi:hypothetical protein
MLRMKFISTNLDEILTNQDSIFCFFYTQAKM